MNLRVERVRVGVPESKPIARYFLEDPFTILPDVAEIILLSADEAGVALIETTDRYSSLLRAHLVIHRPAPYALYRGILQVTPSAHRTIRKLLKQISLDDPSRLMQHLPSPSPPPWGTREIIFIELKV